MGKCIVCQGRTFESQSHCGSNHYVHKECMVESKFKNMPNCTDCQNLFLKEGKWDECTSCHTPLDREDRLICQEYNGLCIKCYIDVVPANHLSNCRRCKIDLNNIIGECENCRKSKKKIDLFQVPKCYEHLFCRSCLAQSTESYDGFHDDCLGYFKSLHRSSPTDQCNLCEELGNYTLKYCKTHKYCNSCYCFVRDKNSENFPSISACKLCRESTDFEKCWKMALENKTEDEKPRSQQSDYKKKLVYSEEFKINRKNPSTLQQSSEKIVLQCECGHKYSEKELQDEEFHDLPNECKSCLKIIACYKNLFKCVLCKETNEIARGNRCDKFGNVCKDCCLARIGIEHVRDCEKCKGNLAEKLEECNLCRKVNSKSEVYELPKCQRHKYCLNCLGRTLGHEEEYGFCTGCVGYFQNNRFCGVYIEGHCNLCREKPTKQLEYCKQHGYCHLCYNFLNSQKNSSEFPSIKQCKNCQASIKFLQSDFEIPKPPEMSNPIKKPSHLDNIFCDVGHEYQKNMITPSSLDEIFAKNCKSCEKVLLKEPTLYFCIYCKSQKIRKFGRYSCYEYVNICEECFCTHVKPGHIDFCHNCQILSLKSIERCYKCSRRELKSMLSQVPRCEEHFFCESCLSEHDDPEFSICEKCVSYFRNIGRYNPMGCNICSLGSKRTEISCERHTYCQTCSDFITGKSFEKYPNVSNCESCKFSINSIKSQKQVLSEIPEESKQFPFEITQKFPEKNFYNDRSQNFDSSPEIKKKNDFNVDDYLNENYPSPSKFKNIEEPSLDIIIPRGDEWISVTPFVPIRKFENYVSSDRLFDLNSSVNLSGFCSNCRNIDVYCAFLCNHNICLECLIYQCTVDIISFFRMYSNDPNSINLGFKYVCPVNSCGKPISVPTYLVVQTVRKMLEQKEWEKNQQRFMENIENLKYLSSLDLSQWIAYFDGIKPQIFLKKFL